MTNILVLSDSHGNISNMLKAVEAEQPDLILHLGDMYDDAVRLSRSFPYIDMEIVKGNCDWCSAKTEKLLTVEGRRILMCHGHKYNVKSGYLALEYAARQKHADIALFGHTHLSFSDYADGLYIMNPGSIGLPRDACGPTYGVISLDNGRIYIAIKTPDRK